VVVAVEVEVVDCATECRGNGSAAGGAGGDRLTAVGDMGGDDAAVVAFAFAFAFSNFALYFAFAAATAALVESFLVLIVVVG